MEGSVDERIDKRIAHAKKEYGRLHVLAQLEWKTQKKKIIRKSLNPKGEFFRRHQQKEMLSLTEIPP
jgi:hypothetical protein